ncbi:hypothetical protein [Bradyrhizobium neotropicale]|uniref:hypothetical protein n=1 Tax=Bradyrhizobium neotropicale TaxID=1497615 RepID=UPI001AD63768|nr:hypothetical protein [Bradyrhizobium neotropicale]MBO4225711.1 hypothetical protein [Bradyrhizobium neotropicale]
MKATSALAALVLSLAPACGAQASTFGHWCERAVKQRMLTPSAYRRVNLIEWQQPVFFTPYFAWPPQQPHSRLEAFVEYDLHNRFGVPLRSMAKCVYGRDY